MIHDEELGKINQSNKGEIVKPAGIFSDESQKKVFKIVKERSKTENELDAKVLTCMVLQIGGSNRGGRKSISYTYNDRKLTSGQLQYACTSAERNGTPRQLARAIAATIIKIAIVLDEPGDVAPLAKAGASQR